MKVVDLIAQGLPEDELVRAVMKLTGALEYEARFIIAVETGVVSGDIEGRK